MLGKNQRLSYPQMGHVQPVPFGSFLSKRLLKLSKSVLK